MAKMIEGVTEKLLQCAKEEFLANGYENASLRTIAERAGSSKSSIFYRYQDKESLYRAVVQPVTDDFCKMMQASLGKFSDLSAEQQEKMLHCDPKARVSSILDYIYDHFDEFMILFTSGETSVQQGFMHTLVDIDTDTTLQYIEKSGNDAISSGRLTSNLAHILSYAFYSGVFEVVIHNMPKEEAMKHIWRLSWFYNAGWDRIFNGGDDSDWMDG